MPGDQPGDAGAEQDAGAAQPRHVPLVEALRHVVP